jgi:hypothetical protein
VRIFGIFIFHQTLIGMIKLRKMERARRTVRTKRIINMYKVFVEKPEGMRSHGGPRCKWEDNVTTNMK